MKQLCKHRPLGPGGVLKDLLRSRRRHLRVHQRGDLHVLRRVRRERVNVEGVRWMTRSLEDEVGAEASRQLERLKWFLWHGNVFRALQVIEGLTIDLDVDDAVQLAARW